MKRKYTIEEIKEAINTAQLKVIEDFEKQIEMVMSIQNMMIVVMLEKELIKELEGK